MGWFMQVCGNLKWRHAARNHVVMAAAVATLALPSRLQGQEGGIPNAPAVKAPRETAPPWRNHANAFAGLTNEDGTYGFTLGADYERRWHRWYGVGVTVESVFGEAREFIVAPMFLLHPVGDLRVALVPGAEKAAGGWDFLFRIELDYAFEWRPGWTVSPTIALDFARGERIVIMGASMGRIF